MPQLETCLSPEQIHLYDLEGKTVVIADILRATSCMVAGKAAGLKELVPVMEIEETIAYRQKGFLRAGERLGKPIEGFDLGNSPHDYIEKGREGASIVMTTTNGTKAIRMSERAEKVYVGAFLNLSAIAEAIRKEHRDTVLFAAGWRGRFSLEDSLFAGALAAKLEGSFEVDDDATLAMVALFKQYEHNLWELMQFANHVGRLKKLAQQRDLELCFSVDKFPVTTQVVEGKVILA